MEKDSLALLKGTLDVLVLKALSGGPLHGYAVARWIESVTDDALEVQEGVLYPALHRLERQGHLRASWGLSETNRKVKHYTLTDLGRSELEAREREWQRYSSAMGKVLAASPE